MRKLVKMILVISFIIVSYLQGYSQVENTYYYKMHTYDCDYHQNGAPCRGASWDTDVYIFLDGVTGGQSTGVGFYNNTNKNFLLSGTLTSFRAWGRVYNQEDEFFNEYTDLEYVKGQNEFLLDYYFKESTCNRRLKAKIQIFVDDPIYINSGSCSINSDISTSLTLNYSNFFDNYDSTSIHPILKYRIGAYGSWNDISTSISSSGGNTDPLYLNNIIPDCSPSYLFDQDIYFRIEKTLMNNVRTKTFGNIIGPYRFYDFPTISVGGAGLVCQGESMQLTGGYKNYPNCDPNADLQVKLKTEPETSWRTITKKLKTTTSLSFDDITSDATWLGQEIQIRPCKTFNGQPVYGEFKTVVFLPTIKNIAISSNAPTCAGGNDGNFVLTFTDIPTTGCKDPNSNSIPLIITIKEYSEFKMSDDITYQTRSDFGDGKTYYYHDGATMIDQVSLVDQNWFLVDNSKLNSRFKLESGKYEISLRINSDETTCDATLAVDFKTPFPFKPTASAQSILTQGGNTYHVKTGDNHAKVKFSFAGGTPPYTVQSNDASGSLLATYTQEGDYTLDVTTDDNNVTTRNYYLSDAHTCPGSDIQEVKFYRPDNITINDAFSTPVDCNVSDINGIKDNGTIGCHVAGGIAPYTLELWSKTGLVAPQSSSNEGNVIFSANPIVPGKYVIKVKDNINPDKVWFSDSITVSTPSPLALTADSISPTCANISDGAFILHPAGGNGTYTYTLDNAAKQFQNYTSGNKILPIGDYNITVSDVKGCSKSTTGKLDRIPLTLDATWFKPASCNSVHNASVRAVVTNYRGSNSNITFYDIYGNGLPSSNSSEGVFYISNLKTDPGMVIKVSDGVCQTQDTVNIPVRQPGLAIFSVTSQKAPCAGKPGTIAIAARHGELPDGTYYQFSIDEDAPVLQTDTTFDYILEGNSHHNFTIIDGMGCSVTSSNVNVDIINNYLRLNQNPETIPGACASTNTGQITVHKIAGTGIGSIDFNLSETGTILSDTAQATFSKLIPRPYNIVATDTKGCKDSVSLVLGVSKDSLALSFFNTKKADCNGGSPTGEIKVSRFVEGNKTGFGDVTFIFKSPVKADSVVYTGLIAGLYTIVAYDTVGCIVSISDSVRFKSNPVSIGVVSKTDQTCNEVQNAQIKLKAATTGSGVAGFRFIFGGDTTTLGNDSITYNLKVAGAYRFSVLDQNNCGNTKFDTIRNLLHSPKPFLDLANPVACSNADNGFLTVHNLPHGSVPTYRYTLGTKTYYTNEETTQVTFQNLNKGTYTIYARDTLGCTDTSKFTVRVEPDSVHIASIDITPSNCVRAQNGKAKIIASSSVFGNTYSMLCNGRNLPGDTVTFTNLAVNDKLVTVTDKYNCVNSKRFSITVQKDTLNLVLSHQVNTNCPGTSNGKIILNRTFGNSVYRFNMQSSTGSQTFYNSGNEVTVSGLPSDVYNISVTDTVNCKAEVNNITLFEPEQVSFFSTYNNYIKRKGEATGSMYAKIWKGNHKYNYEWYAIGTGNTLLNSGTAYDTSTIKIDNRIAGNYLLRVQDTAKCFVNPTEWLEKIFTLAEPAKDLSIAVVRNKPVSCNGNSDGEIEVSGVGGWGNFYTYGLDALHIAQSGTFSNLLAGTVTVFAKDSSGVTASLPVTIIQPVILTAKVASKADATCYGTPNGSVQLSISGGNTPYYAVSADDKTYFRGTIVQNLLSKNYSNFYVRDTLGCIAKVDTSLFIDQPKEMIVVDTTITKTHCGQPEGSIIATINGGVGGYTYSWTDPDNNGLASTSNSAFNLLSGTYRLHVMDANQCPKIFAFDVWDITDLTIDSVATIPVSCWGYSDGKAKVYISKGNPDYTIFWPDNSGGSSVNGLLSGTFDVKVTDAKQCKTHQNFTIGTPDNISLEGVTRSNPLCEGYSNGSLSITPIGSFGNYSYQWENGEQTNTCKGLLPGTYSVTVTDSHNCFNHFALDMWYQQTIYPSLGKDYTLCKGNNSILSPGVYDIYQWSSNNTVISHDPQITVDKAGTYVLQVKDNDGCIGHDTITIGQSATLETGKLLIATSVEQHDTVMIFQESWPTPDSVKFDLSGCTILSGDKYYREVIFADTGTYTIGLTSYLNDCRDVVEKQIRVEPKSNSTLKSTPSRLIQLFTLSPNPNSGQFKAEIRLRETADVVLQVANISNGVIMDIREFKGSDIYTINYNLNLPSGTYLLYLQAGKEAKTRTFIIQK
jgi:hypothetical protein